MIVLESNKKILYSVILIFCFISAFAFVYASTPINYSVDMAKVDVLFESEQDILSSYTLVTGMTEDIVEDLNFSEQSENMEIATISEDGILLETNLMDVTIGYSDTMIGSVESMTSMSLSDFTLFEHEEEYYANNRLSSRSIEDEVGSANETLHKKLFRLFGDDAKNMIGRVMYYPDGEEQARQDMQTFSVVVWDIDENGEWFQKNHRLTSHKALVKTLECIFSELLELPEEDRVPIKIMGCYNYRAGSSAHTCGAAIDINWAENAEMTLSGRVTAGHYWKPGEDIYSIKPDSPFVHIFEKYGWTWGGYWTSKKDYMHFSYIDR